jgi:hypothetical protein
MHRITEKKTPMVKGDVCRIPKKNRAGFTYFYYFLYFPLNFSTLKLVFCKSLYTACAVFIQEVNEVNSGIQISDVQFNYR